MFFCYILHWYGGGRPTYYKVVRSLADTSFRDIKRPVKPFAVYHGSSIKFTMMDIRFFFKLYLNSSISLVDIFVGIISRHIRDREGYELLGDASPKVLSGFGLL